MAAQAVFILIDRRSQDGGAVGGADAGNVFLRDANERRRRRKIVTGSDHVHCGSRRRWHGGCCSARRFRQHRADCCRRETDGPPWGRTRRTRWRLPESRVRAAVVATRCSPAHSGRAAAAPRRCALCGAWQEMHALAAHRAVASEVGLQRYFVRWQERARWWTNPASGLTWPLHRAVGIVAGQAHLRFGAVSHQKILRHLVVRLHVRIVARRALDVSVDQLHRAGRVSGFTLRRQRRHQIDLVFDGQLQAERVRRLQVCCRTHPGCSSNRSW